MTREQIQHEIEKIDQQLQDLKENRCEALVCTTNEYQKSLQIQELLEQRTELYYQLNKDDKKPSTKSEETSGLVEQQARHQEKLEIAKNLIDLLDDETISAKTGLAIETVKQLRV